MSQLPLALDPAPAAPAQELTPLLRPRFPTYYNQDMNGPDRGVQQPVHTLHAAKDKTVPAPKFHNLLADNVVFPQVPQKKPTLRNFGHKLRKFDGNDQPTTDLAQQSGVALEGANQNGRYPSDPGQLDSVPGMVDYKSARGLQLMSQLSEVSLAYLKSQHHDTEEVEFGYGHGKKTDDLRLYASTNDSDSAVALHGALSDPRAMLRWAMKKGDADVKAVATKLSFFSEQQQQRRQQPGADRDGLALGDALHQRFLGGDVHVVPGDRHSEQNAAEAMHEDSRTRGEIGGTKIRCGACTAELGANLKHPDGRYACGKVYPRQADVDKWGPMFDQVRGRQLAVDPRAPSRPRSNSPVAAWKRKDPKAPNPVPKPQEQQAALTTPTGGISKKPAVVKKPPVSMSDLASLGSMRTDK